MNQKSSPVRGRQIRYAKAHTAQRAGLEEQRALQLSDEVSMSQLAMEFGPFVRRSYVLTDYLQQEESLKE